MHSPRCWLHRPGPHRRRTARAEAQLGWDRPSIDLLLSDTDVYATGEASKDGLSYGGEIGYDVPVASRFLLGVYGGVTGATTSECQILEGDEGCIKAGRNFYAGLRAGVKVSDGVLIYAKGGYSNGRVRLTYRDDLEPANDFAIADNVYGFHVGGGVEVNLSEKIYSKLEYLHTDYSDYDYRDGTLGFRARIDRDAVLYGFGYRF